ncbi:MAG: T9SS type A sorting domain-containing protein [Bacteroidota bacterium]
MFKKVFFLTFLIVINNKALAQTQIGTNINGEAAGDNSGGGVALSSTGNIVAIGARFNDGNGVDSGHVRLFQNISNVWTQIGNDINGETAGNTFGWSVALSSDGSIVAVGAANVSGYVRIYQNISGTWTQIGNEINNEMPNDGNGWSISLSNDGTIIAIGAIYNDGNGTNSGHVRIYQNVSNVWTQIGNDIDGEVTGDYSGINVSLSNDGSIVAIGAQNNDENGQDSGHVRVFQNTLGTWVQIGNDINGEAAGDNSGSSVAISGDGNIVAVGARYNDGNAPDAGHVRIFQNISNVWTQVGNDINGQIANDYFGTSISLSNDGNTIAIGSPGNIGKVLLYKNTANNWTQMGNTINDDTDISFGGRNIALSSNGTTLANGMLFAEGNGIVSGYVKVYDLTTILATDSFILENSKVYPNPVKNELHIDLEQGLTLQEVNIYSTLGQFIKKEKTNIINVSSLSKGFYFIQIVTEKGKATHKILIE